jgi:hypothetical protein
MKYIASLICLLLVTISTPSFALKGSDCSAKSAKLNPSEREDFMKSCLAQAEDPANVKEEERKHKSAVCEQNAKNKKLQGNDKANYLTNCMNKNEAATVASAQPKSTAAAPSHKVASNNSAKGESHKAAKKQKEHHKNGKKDAKTTAAKPAAESAAQ